MWYRFLFSSLLLLGLAGCGRSVLSFDLAGAGLVRPTIFLSATNAPRIIDRIRWLEEARFWEQSKVQAHALSRLLGDDSAVPVSPACGLSCTDCLSAGSVPIFGVDEKLGQVDLACQTKRFLQGAMIMEIPSVDSKNGYGYVDWLDVCQPNKDADPSLCMKGVSSYRVILTRESLVSRLDLLWVVRLWVREGSPETPEIRLDGIKGFSYTQRVGPPDSERSAIFLEDSSLLYSRYQKDLRTVDILASNGSFRCSFSTSPRTGSCQPIGSGNPISW